MVFTNVEGWFGICPGQTTMVFLRRKLVGGVIFGGEHWTWWDLPLSVAGSSNSESENMLTGEEDVDLL